MFDGDEKNRLQTRMFDRLKTAALAGRLDDQLATEWKADAGGQCRTDFGENGFEAFHAWCVEELRHAGVYL